MMTEKTASLKERIDAALENYCSQFPKGTLWEAMRYSLLLPGKRLRPILVFLAVEACNGSESEAMPAACSLEMIHAFSLIHDDLPAMDNDNLRRGKPTNHKVYGEAQAILAGDALLAFAFDVLASGIADAEIAIACCRELASATVWMTHGQSLDIEGLPIDATIDDLEDLSSRKTGALIACALRMGGRIAGADDEHLRALTRYGQSIGLAFQITDDLLDVTASAQDLGKATGKDADKGKKTYPMIVGIEKSQERVATLITQAEESLSMFGDRGESLKALARGIARRKA